MREKIKKELIYRKQNKGILLPLGRPQGVQ